MRVVPKVCPRQTHSIQDRGEREGWILYSLHGNREEPIKLFLSWRDEKVSGSYYLILFEYLDTKKGDNE